MSRPLALVIGAAGGIGAATAQVLAEQGTSVWACDVRDCGQVVSGLSGSGHRSSLLDVTDAVAVDHLVAELWRAENLAAIAYTPGVLASGPVADVTAAGIDRTLGVNLVGAMSLAAAVHRRLRVAPRSLSMVFLSSVAGLRGEGGGSLYCASKFGLIGFVQSFAAEVAEYGVRVNTVCPGNVDTPMLRELATMVADRQGTDSDAVLEEFAAASAFDRLITARQVADVCGWLLTGPSSGISGQSIVVDGPPKLT